MVPPDESGGSRAKDIFLDAIELSAEERPAFISSRSAGDESLSQRVQELLAAHEAVEASDSQGNDWLPAMPKVPALFANDEQAANDEQELVVGATLGAYQLISEIGQGGFGRVWLAQQSEPVRRRVALKVLKAGLDTREVIQRFRAERQALALMDHASIARIFDGGSTQRGLPWFAMEYVDGVPITVHCEAKELGTRARLNLFLATCRAVQHAHQKGVIHRDLKPTNVLVAEVDGEASPKVIDFGIAKAIEQSLTPDSMETRIGQVIGTPGYMSPEQLDHGADIDTRADVYSLGALLYELLTGAAPFAKDAGEAGALDGLLTAIREVDPLLPSLRLQRRLGLRAKATGPTPSGPIPDRLRPRELRGDLDWIVMRCLEKSRERRYDSVALLANDLERHLAGDTVLAGPPTVRYRLSKLVKRYRSLLAFAAVVFGLLVGGIVSSTNQAARAREAEARTRVELERFESISVFMEELLMGLDPAEAGRMDTRLLLHLLDRAARDLDKTAREPEVEATIARILGNAYLQVAEYPRAETHFRRSLALREELEGPQGPNTLLNLEDLAGLLMHTNRPAQAEPLLERCHASRKFKYGADDEATQHVLINLATVHRMLRKHELAEREFEELLAWHREHLGPHHASTLLVRNNMASNLGDQGRLEEALSIYEEVLEAQLELVGEEHPDALSAMNNVGSQLTELGHYQKAMPLLERSLEIKREVLAEGHPSVLVAFSSLARVVKASGDYDTAEALYSEALDLGYGHLEADDRRLLVLEYNRASLINERGRRVEARELIADLLPRVEAVEGSDSVFLGTVREFAGRLGLR